MHEPIETDESAAPEPIEPSDTVPTPARKSLEREVTGGLALGSEEPVGPVRGDMSEGRLATFVAEREHLQRATNPRMPWIFGALFLVLGIAFWLASRSTDAPPVALEPRAPVAAKPKAMAHAPIPVPSPSPAAVAATPPVAAVEKPAPIANKPAVATKPAVVATKPAAKVSAPVAKAPAHHAATKTPSKQSAPAHKEAPRTLPRLPPAPASDDTP